jgi:hypothetical protein
MRRHIIVPAIYQTPAHAIEAFPACNGVGPNNGAESMDASGLMCYSVIE